MLDYTVVTGVDAKHLWQLQFTWPTWRKHKPELLDHPMIAFADDVEANTIRRIVDHPNLTVVQWPPHGITFSGDGSSKWKNPQRHKMLAAFVYIPAKCVKTPYWLKLDTDAVATGMPDWIDPNWFDDSPAIISHPWGFTRPGDQMLKLDQWVEDHRDILHLFWGTQPLKLAPKPGEGRVHHPRIGSWCAFFSTVFTEQCAMMASTSCGPYQLPVPSQDGFTWYCATRMGLPVIRTSMKHRGWNVWSSSHNVEYYARQAMEAASGVTV